MWRASRAGDRFHWRVLNGHKNLMLLRRWWLLYRDDRNGIEAADVADPAETARITAHPERQTLFFDSRVWDLASDLRPFGNASRRVLPKKRRWLSGFLCGPLPKVSAVQFLQSLFYAPRQVSRRSRAAVPKKSARCATENERGSDPRSFRPIRHIRVFRKVTTVPTE